MNPLGSQKTWQLDAGGNLVVALFVFLSFVEIHDRFLGVLFRNAAERKGNEML